MFCPLRHRFEQNECKVMKGELIPASAETEIMSVFLCLAS